MTGVAERAYALRSAHSAVVGRLSICLLWFARLPAHIASARLKCRVERRHNAQPAP